MKTTLELPDALLIEAKATAARQRITLKKLFTRALEKELQPVELPQESENFIIDEYGWPVYRKKDYNGLARNQRTRQPVVRGGGYLMKLLFDVNTLLARFHVEHVHHHRVSGYLDSQVNVRLLTCPITENGFLRIFSHPSFPAGPGNMPDAVKQLLRIRSVPGHEFIPDNLSICDREAIPGLKKTSPKQLTDLYLLALAVRHKARFVTLDEKIPAHLVAGGSDACIVIPA